MRNIRLAITVLSSECYYLKVVSHYTANLQMSGYTTGFNQ